MADRIAVLRNGKLVGVVRTPDTSPEEVMTMMIGEAVSALEPAEEIDPSVSPLFVAKHVSSGSATDVSFSIRPGEIVGLYGLVGSGRSSLARAISGNQGRDSGSVTIDGTPFTATTARAALRRGVAYMTEDRRREGFVTDFTNGFNLTLATPGKNSTFGVINRRSERARVEEIIQDYQVKGGADTLTRNLSGGNQQKVCIAKWLEADPRVVILDEPTKGIDVGARLNIYQIIRRLAMERKAVLVVTSEAEEALKLCNRILVLREGRVVGEFSPHNNTTNDLIRASLGGDPA